VITRAFNPYGSECDFCQLEVIERERDLTQIIVHVDMDAFYANVELLGDPSLAGKAFGVRLHLLHRTKMFQFSLQVGHGVLSTASYEARKYGVRSGMPGKICAAHGAISTNFAKATSRGSSVPTSFLSISICRVIAKCPNAS
jgi:DNA polymerase kappa